MTFARASSGLCVAGLPFLLPVLLVATPPSPKLVPEEGSSFSLIPRAFQSNPLVDQTVITEMTEEGRKLRPPSPAHPAYYVTEIAGYHSAGGSTDDHRLPAAEEIAAILQRALAVRNYLPAGKEHPPALLIVCFWGAHTNLDAGSSEIDGSETRDLGHKNLLSRAALVGGTKFAEELRVALQKQDEELLAQQGRTRGEDRLGIQTEIGSILIDHGPLRQFTDRDATTRALWEACGERYYVIASAYDYAGALCGQHRLLWRTKMTVDAQSISLRDALPGLIANSGPYFGLDMAEAATMTRHLHRETEVLLGPLQVKEYNAPPPDRQEKP